MGELRGGNGASLEVSLAVFVVEVQVFHARNLSDPCGIGHGSLDPGGIIGDGFLRFLLFFDNFIGRLLKHHKISLSCCFEIPGGSQGGVEHTLRICDV